MYANNAPSPIQEDTAPRDIMHDTYSLTKGLAEQVAQFAWKNLKLPVTILRLSNIYGPHQDWKQYPNLVPQIITQALSEKKITVFNPNPIRDFLFVADAVDAFVKLLETDTPTGIPAGIPPGIPIGMDAPVLPNPLTQRMPYQNIFNLGTGIGTPIGEVVAEVAGVTNADVELLNKETWGPTKVICDITKIKNATGWSPRTSVKEGIAMTVKYYKGVL